MGASVEQQAVVQRDRMKALLEAVTTISGELDLQVVLRRIAEAAALLVDARYAALGVIATDGSLAQFVTVGLDEEQTERIGPLPHGLGLLGELIRHPQPLRLPDLRAHPSSYGFPANHPPMTTFLGVPIRVRGQVFGNLYLTDKRSGEFDDGDEALVLGLAAAVGITVENARLYEGSQRRERAAAATTEITTSLLSGAEPETVLELAAERAGALLAADLGLIALHYGSRLLIEVSWGPAKSSPAGTLTADGPLGAVLDSGEPRVFEPRQLSHVWPGIELGAAVAVPLGAGVCVAARASPGLPFTAEEVAELTSFAAQATVALELAQRRRDTERLSVYDDRDRIARDLHDLVIQRLFATGMQLEGAVRQIADPVPQGRVRQAVDDLDQTIREIRSSIYALQHEPHLDSPSLRARVLEVVDAGEELLGFAPSLRLSGLLDTTVPEHLVDDVVCVLREALSNAARHAKATAVSVLVEASDDVVVRVVDDGVGVPLGGRRSGLRNLAERAALAGGRFAAQPGATGGTDLLWRAPLTR
ncbi:MAG: histidine kinase [Frankiales bacterium]|nr:histidine kinase [Frankiales bacterium]